MWLMLAAWLLVAGSGFPVSVLYQEPLDRTLALVGGQPITLSDARGALALGLIDVEPAPSPIVVATGRLIQRELILREVQRYAPGAPSESVVDTRLEQVRKRFPDAAAMNRVLEANGFTEARLRGWVRDDLRTESYLAQRFASASTPTDADIAAAYARSKAEFDNSNMSFERAAPIVRDRLIESRRRELILDWVSDLRRRTEVVMLEQ
jgi:hypothetical protein